MVYLAVLTGLILLALFFRWQNNGLVVTQIDYTLKDVPREFNGFIILHVSDLHNKTFGQDQKKIASVMAQTQPHIIAISGDIIDKRRGGMSAALALAAKAVKIAPVFYVPGNHERASGIYEQLADKLKARGVKVIANDTMTIERKGAVISIVGVKDWQFLRPLGKSTKNDEDRSKTDKQFAGIISDLAAACPKGFRLLLSHRPEKFDIYVQTGCNLVLSGHAHGGQWRLPIIGGLYAPHQGIFPKYTSGLHIKGKTGMVVSRGLGNSLFPLRLFNRPELVVITLKHG